jgi:hypothetical protein
MEQVRESRSRVNPKEWVPVLLWRVKGVGERGTCRVYPSTYSTCINGRCVWLVVFGNVEKGSHGPNVWGSSDSVWQKYGIRMWNHSPNHQRNIEDYLTAHTTPEESLISGVWYGPIHRSRLTLVLPRSMYPYPPSPPFRTQRKLRMASLLDPNFSRSV